ncbi:heavy-metal-associated domain-containing protein [Nocardioides sp. AX2bis]|uniref:heavy-metal-associated domain-containing protein n=1 Tax=Nocardioides sp. AX2bis TaxID=2653157 RepID=UPI0012F11C59|nr:heavy metal-associated domain-containing protein [Nocardioides sp. AX2bis]VXC45633.1 Copper chaperone [Nocardioides sp. AX2bis]
MTRTSEWTVAGMTCEHCVASVTEEISEIATVTDVAVTLDGGRVVVTSEAPLERSQVEQAVTEAGYVLG